MMVASPLLLLALAAGASANFFGTQPFSDSVVQGPQHIPGKVRLAYADQGGEGKAYHTKSGKNDGSCSFNPCDGTYLNSFRGDEGISTSYTKKAVGTWPGDIYHSNASQVEFGNMYWGWNEVGNWCRVSVVVDTPGKYIASLFYTSNQGGTIDFTVSNSETGQALVDLKNVTVPTTEQYHNWDLNPIFEVDFTQKGLQVLTIKISSIGGDGSGQFGNLMYLDFEPKAKRRSLRW